MERSDSIAKVAAALVGAQGELENVAKDAENPHFRNRYASLPAILDAVRPVLAKHGLAVIQFPTNTDDGRVGVETTILHASGEYLTHDFAVRLTKDDAQGAGSALTYCRRYSLAAVLAISQDDDDGNGAAAPAPQRRESPPPQRSTRSSDLAAEPYPITDPQRKRLLAISYQLGETAGLKRDQVEAELKAVMSHYGYESTKDIRKGHYDAIVDEISKVLRGYAEPSDDAKTAAADLF